MVVLKWIGMFLVYWIVGTIISLVITFALAFIGIGLPEYITGLITLIVIVIGLIRYGTKKKKEVTVTN